MPAEPHDASVFVSRFNRVVAVVIWVLDALVLATLLLRDEPTRALALVPAAFIALFAWLVLWSPDVRVDADGVRLRNVFRTIQVPWAALIHVDTRYALTLFTPGHRFAAWAAPAPGRTGTTIARRAERRGRVDAAPTVDGTVRPGDLLGSESGQAAAMVRDQWTRLREAGEIPAGVADETPVGIRWHWSAGGLLVLLAAGTVAALLVMRF
jgi:hypothetical protein